MTRIGKTVKFLRATAGAFHGRLPGQWEARGPAHAPRLVRCYSWGVAGLQPRMTYRGLPNTRVSFTYGLSFTELSPLLAKLDEADGYPPMDFFDVYQDTFNRPLSGKGRWSDVADYNSCEFGQVYQDLLGGAEGELLAFFSRFGDLRELRRSLAHGADGDGSFSALGREPIITAIDCLLGDFRHLRRFRDSLGDSSGSRMVERAAGVLGVPL